MILPACLLLLLLAVLGRLADPPDRQPRAVILASPPYTHTHNGFHDTGGMGI